jgi:hypothetical protein
MLSRHSIALSIAAILGVSGSLADEDIVGRWTGETFAAGTTTLMTLELFKNGTYARRIVAASELGWSASGDTLLIAPLIARVDNEVTYGKAAAVLVKITGDQMVQSAGSKSLNLKRVTSPVASAPILGRWEGQGDLNEEVIQDFTVDGRLIVTVTVSREAGRWSATDQEIRWEMQIPEPGRRRSKFKLQKGKLLLYIARDLPPIEMTREPPASASR